MTDQMKRVRAEVCRWFLRLVDLEHLWSDDGPTEAARRRLAWERSFLERRPDERVIGLAFEVWHARGGEKCHLPCGAAITLAVENVEASLMDWVRHLSECGPCDGRLAGDLRGEHAGDWSRDEPTQPNCFSIGVKEPGRYCGTGNLILSVCARTGEWLAPEPRTGFPTICADCPCEHQACGLPPLEHPCRLGCRHPESKLTGAGRDQADDPWLRDRDGDSGELS